MIVAMRMHTRRFVNFNRVVDYIINMHKKENHIIPDSLESGLRSTRGVHLAGSDDVACKIVQNHLPGGLKM